MKSKLVAILAAASVGIGAIADTTQTEKIEALKAQITSQQKTLGELQVAVRKAHKEQKGFAVKLGWDLGKTIVYGVAATELFRQSYTVNTSKWWPFAVKAGSRNPIIRAANEVRKIDPNGGFIQGPAPRFLERESVFYSLHAFNAAVITTAALASVVKAYDVSTDGVVLFVDWANIARLEAVIQVDQEKLSRALADLAALEATN